MAVKNPAVKQHTFLDPMRRDRHFPGHLGDKGARVLGQLAERIEQEQPKGEAVYALTHETTQAFNDLQEEFFAADSEIETVAREAIAADFKFLLTTYGYAVDLEMAIAPRDW